MNKQLLFIGILGLIILTEAFAQEKGLKDKLKKLKEKP